MGAEERTQGMIGQDDTRRGVSACREDGCEEVMGPYRGGASGEACGTFVVALVTITRRHLPSPTRV